MNSIGAPSRGRHPRRRLALLAGVACTVGLALPVRTGAQAPGSRLAPVATLHPALPTELSLYWLVPNPAARAVERRDAGAAGLRNLAQGSQLVAKQEFSKALTLLASAGTSPSAASDYARYYTGVAQAGAGRQDEALLTFSLLAARDLQGALRELVPARLGEVSLSVGAPDRAEGALSELTEGKLADPPAMWLLRGRVEEAAGHRAHALEAFRTIHYQFPTSAAAPAARDAIARLQTPETVLPDAGARDLDRAERLFSARKWAEAKAAFTALATNAPEGTRDLVALRLAECEHYLGNRRGARDLLRPLLTNARHGAEARYFYLTATRALGDHATYVRLARTLVGDHPRSPWAEETLNALATHYITANQDDAADRVLRQLLREYPRSRFSERAAWKVGWRSFRQKRYAETAEIFDAAAVTFPRADYRPAWIYWAGRAYDQLGDRATANARYRLSVLDYRNSYYGRLATGLLVARKEAPVTTRVAQPPAPTLTAVLPTEGLIRELVGARMYAEALQEVRYAQAVWGDTPQLQATAAWIRHQQGLALTADERFAAVRGAITTMRRAYPQFMAAGGEGIPAEVLRVIFPLDYWPLITKYATLHALDPYLVAALMAQESTFTAEIRSHANAYGLMQIIPSTGRVYARKLGIRSFTTAMLRQPETNVRIGTRYFKDLMTRFGGAHFALAGYNAGEGRVARWLAERPGVPQDEFVDDIPFPETQGYVKRILGTAEDYRALYGAGGLDPDDARLDAPASDGPVNPSRPSSRQTRR